MNEWHKDPVRLKVARLGLILVLAAIALWAWPAAEAHADAPFATSYGGTANDYALAMQQTADGGYVVAGATTSFGAGEEDIWVLKLNADGGVAWQKTYGGTSWDSARAIQQTADGGYVVAGQTESFGAGGYDAWVLKLNADGGVAWQRTYGGADYDFASAVRQTTDGGYIVAGQTSSFGAGQYDVWVLKLNADGGVAWQRTYGGTFGDSAYAIQQTADGGYVVAGEMYSSGAGLNAWVLKLNADGDVAWQKIYGGAKEDSAYAIQQTDDGGYVVAGGTVPYGISEGDGWVLKLDADGNVAWQKTCSGVNKDYALAIQQTADGGYVVAGWTDSFGAGEHDAWTLKLNADGSVAWQKTYGGADDDDVFAIQQTADGGYVVAGWTDSFGAGEHDAWVLKLDANGDFCAGCALGEDVSVAPADGNAAVADSTTTPADSTVTPADSNATVIDTGVIPEPICVCVAEPALSITKDVTPTDKVPYHGTVTYTIVLGNSGTGNDTNVFLTDTLPAEVDFARWVPDGQPAGAEVVADELTWQGAVTAGQAIAFTFVVSHVGDYGDVVTNTARFSGTQQAGEDSATFAVVRLEPDLFIAKGATPMVEVPYHGTVTYTVVLDNSGLVSDTNVLLTDTLPVEVDFVRWVEQPAGAEVVSDALTWSGTVTVGQAITFTFVVSYVGEYGNVVTNTARFSGTLQAGEDSATFTAAAYAVHLPLIVKTYQLLLPVAITYGGMFGDSANAIQQTADGGYVVAGDMYSLGVIDDVWVLKLNDDGSVVWQRTYGGTEEEHAEAMQQTADGGYVVAGRTNSFGAGDYDAWVLKLNADGSVAWQKTYGGTAKDYVYAIQRTADGGYVVAGYTYSFGAGEYDAWVLKLNADGGVAWQKIYGGAKEDSAYAIQQTADGGYIVAGSTSSFGGQDAWMLKLDADGGVAWQKTYGGTDGEYAQAIQQTADGGYVVAGGAGFWHGQTYAWVLKLNADGSVAWHKIYVVWDDCAYAIQQTADGGYVVAGYTASGAGRYDAWVLKLNADGSEAWQKTYGGEGWDQAHAIQQMADGGYVVAGSTTSFGAGEYESDAWVLKLDADGGFCEGCPLGEDRDLSPKDGSASAVDSDAVPVDSNATVIDSSATVTDTNVIPEPICACPLFIGNRAE